MYFAEERTYSTLQACLINETPLIRMNYVCNSGIFLFIQDFRGFFTHCQHLRRRHGQSRYAGFYKELSLGQVRSKLTAHAYGDSGSFSGFTGHFYAPSDALRHGLCEIFELWILSVRRNRVLYEVVCSYGEKVDHRRENIGKNRG